MSHTSTGLLVLALTLIGFTANATTYSEKQLNCLAQNIYHEARGEPDSGQLAVAFVTLNRTEDERFPNSICNVVYQTGQFSWTKRNPKIKERDAWNDAKIIAKRAVFLYTEGKDNTRGAVYFDGGKHKQPFHKRRTIRIGNHSFYQ
jgi:spore germination cell wall hydrolase CwlJ-like protein